MEETLTEEEEMEMKLKFNQEVVAVAVILVVVVVNGVKLSQVVTQQLVVVVHRIFQAMIILYRTNI